MVASIGAVAAPSQGASYYEKDGYYAKDDPEHRAASAWAGKGAEELGLKGPVDPDAFKAILEGRVSDAGVPDRQPGAVRYRLARPRREPRSSCRRRRRHQAERRGMNRPMCATTS